MEFTSDNKSKHEPYLELTLDQFQILGRSIAGIETVLAIPQWNVCFDVGRAPDFAFSQDHLALTHWHLDHAGGVAFYLGLRHLNSLKPLKLIVPQEKVEETAGYIQYLRKLSESELKCDVVPAAENVLLKRDLMIRGIPSYHSIPSSGYLIEQRKRHLKPAFRGQSSAEILEAKQAGRDVEEEQVDLLFALSGDTKAEFFETEAVKAKYLVMECSFFGDDSNYQKIRDYGHTHILDWKKYADRIASECIIMTHTSQRYSKKEVAAACRKNLPKDLLDRLIVFR